MFTFKFPTLPTMKVPTINMLVTTDQTNFTNRPAIQKTHATVRRFGFGSSIKSKQSSFHLQFHSTLVCSEKIFWLFFPYGLFIWRRVVPGRRVTLHTKPPRAREPFIGVFINSCEPFT